MDPMTLDANSICRCCLSDRRDTLRSIYDANIRDMFVACTSLPVNTGDGLPGRICSACVFKCISWSSFKQLCERSEEMLRIQYNIPSMATEKEEEPPDISQSPMEVEELSTFTEPGEIIHIPTTENKDKVVCKNPVSMRVDGIQTISKYVHNDDEVGITGQTIETMVVYEVLNNQENGCSDNELDEFTGFKTIASEMEDTCKSIDEETEDMVTISDSLDYQVIHSLRS